ncbi:MAG TPA: DUF2804 domain-containing protein [Acholeplasmatales bacterium]|nr:MAG: hypothetical protein A2Y16_00860 [Tenericutes bacterium GWF2_57_13]HAQ57022.1 DUF2804 domain-containing protein [Acholeplasmatales bacterium]
MQNEIKEKQPLFDASGHLANPGYAKRMLFEYARKDVKASGWRIKEWDYYAVLNDDFGFSCTIADLSYSSLVSANFIDFKTGTYLTKSKIGWFTFGKMGLPSTSETGNVGYHDKVFDFDFHRDEAGRRLRVQIRGFCAQGDLAADIQLEAPDDDSMVIATPWPTLKPRFYLNQKINCMPATGTVKVGDRICTFDPASSFGVLDWGRGAWTYKNTWYWGSASGMAAGSRFGFNIGYGFGDTSKASENMMFFDGKAHKLDQVTFHLDDTDVMKPWTFTSNDGRFEMTMTPLVDRQDEINFGIIKNLGHQVFGRFAGWVVLDDGSRLEIKDLLGFAEKITNHY